MTPRLVSHFRICVVYTHTSLRERSGNIVAVCKQVAWPEKSYRVRSNEEFAPLRGITIADGIDGALVMDYRRFEERVNDTAVHKLDNPYWIFNRHPACISDYL